MDKSSKTIFIGLGVVVVAAAVFALSPSQEAPKKKNLAALAAGVKGGATGSTTAGPAVKGQTVDYFTPGEEKMRFDRLSTSPKNGFRPIIERKTLGKGAGASQAPNAVPSDMSGESGWVYTGTMAIDGSPSALFENKSKNEAEYVTVGQKWKKCTIQGITSTTVTLVGQGGRVFTADLLADPPQSTKTGTAATTPLAVNSMPGSLPGAGGMSFQMDANGNMVPGATDGTAFGGAQMNQGRGRGRGGRRGGNNFGGGGGGSATVEAAPAPVRAPGFQPEIGLEGLPDTPQEGANP